MSKGSVKYFVQQLYILFHRKMYFLQKKTYVQKKLLFTETIFKYVQEQAADTLMLPTGLADKSRVLNADTFPTWTMANLLATPSGIFRTHVAPLSLHIDD